MQLARLLLVVSLALVAACSSAASSASSAGSTSSTSVLDDRGGVPPGYPLNVDAVAPLVITTVAADPVPVTGTDGKVHVVYEL